MLEINPTAKKRKVAMISLNLTVPIMVYDDEEKEEIIKKYLEGNENECSEEVEELLQKLDALLKEGIYKIIPEENRV